MECRKTGGAAAFTVLWHYVGVCLRFATMGCKGEKKAATFGFFSQTPSFLNALRNLDKTLEKNRSGVSWEERPFFPTASLKAWR